MLLHIVTIMKVFCYKLVLSVALISINDLTLCTLQVVGAFIFIYV